MKKQIKENKINIIIFTILGLIIIYLGCLQFNGLSPTSFEKTIKKYEEYRQQQEQEKVSINTSINKDDHVHGNEDAEFTIFEYSDFECPFCKRFAGTAKKLVDESNGTVNTVFRHFPLSFHDPMATKAAVASECVNEQAGNEAFFKFHDLYFENTKTNGAGLTDFELIELVKKINVDSVEFQKCLISGKYESKVQEQMAKGVEIGINGTPGVIIRNNITKEVVRGAGAEPIESLRSKIESLRTDVKK